MARIRTNPFATLAPHRGRIVVTATLLALVGCTGGDRPRALHGVTLTPARAKPDFTLESVDGRPFDFLADTRGSVTLLFFGYTNCPDVCPTHLANIAYALRQLPDDTRRHVRMVFVTTDPARDTPERLRSWLAQYDSTFVGLRGSLDDVNAIQYALKLPPAQMEHMASASGPQSYGVGHAAQVLAFTQDDSLRAEYPSGVQREDWVHDLRILVEDYAANGSR
jgi:protein SCO1/2